VIRRFGTSWAIHPVPLLCSLIALALCVSLPSCDHTTREQIVTEQPIPLTQWKPTEAKLLGREPVERAELPAEWQDFSDEELRKLCRELVLEGHSLYAGYPESPVGFDFEKSLDLMSKALYIARSLQDQDLAEPALYGISVSLRGQGEMEQAIEYSRVAVSEIPEDDHGGLAEAAKLHGLNLLAVGDFIGALQNLQRSYEAYVQAGRVGGQINALAETADVYYRLGLKEQALQYFTEVERLADEFASYPFRGLSLVRLGEIHCCQGEYGQAEECFQEAVKVLEGVPPRYYGIVCESHLALGDLHVLTGNNVEARATYTAALEYAEEGQQPQLRARSLFRLAELRAQTGNAEEALAGFGQAIEAAEASLASSTAADAYAARAALHRSNGDLLLAANDLQHTYALCREQAASLPWETGLGGGLVGDLYAVGTELASLEVESGNPEDAFAALQAAKSTPLLKLLAQSRQHTNNPATQDKFNSFRAVNAGIQELRAELNRLPAPESTIGGDKQRDTRKNLVSRIQEQSSKAAVIWAEIRTAEPLLAGIIETRTVSANEMQRGILRPRQVLIEYALTPHGILIFALPQRGEMKVAVVPLEGFKTPFGEWLTEQVAMQLDPRESRWRAAGRELYDLLMAPLSSAIERADHLIICPDQGLFNVMFEALVEPDGTLLIDHYAITYAASATAHSYVAQARRSNKGALVAGIDFAVHGANGEEDTSELQGECALGEAERPTLAPLSGVPDELSEVAAILRASPQLDKNMTEGWLAANLPSMRVVHLATHGRLSEVPLTNGLYVSLPPSPDEGTDGQGDGFLSMAEVMGIRLEGCELVVLSCCHSAEGDTSPGQGLMGLAQGFLCAGASSVLASTDRISDEAARKLMCEFYDGWWNRGLPKSESLRAAKLKLRTDPAFSDPRFWAPFVLYGTG